MKPHTGLCDSRMLGGYPCTCDNWHFRTLREPDDSGTMTVYVTHTDGSTSQYADVRVPEIGEPITIKGDRIEFENSNIWNPRLTTVLNVRSFYSVAE